MMTELKNRKRKSLIIRLSLLFSNQIAINGMRIISQLWGYKNAYAQLV